MTLHYAPKSSSGFSGAASHWLRQTLTRSNIIDAVKTLTWLAPLTLLIWIYAERQNVDTLPNQTVPIRVVSADSKHYVVLHLPGGEHSVVAELTGPHARMDDVKRQIALQNDKPAVEIQVDPSLGPGSHDLDAAQALSKSPIFANSGVTVSNCKPTVLPVFIDDYAEQEVEIQPSPGAANLEGAVTFNPPKVKVRAPSKLLDPKKNISVFADLQRTNLLSDPGKHENAKVFLYADILSSDGVSISKASVDATFTVRRMDAHLAIAAMNVSVQASLDLWNKYRVEPKDDKAVIYNVELVGPQDKLDALHNGQLPPPVAVFQLTRENAIADGGWHTANLEVKLPDGVTVDSSSLKPFEYKVVARPAE